MTKWTDEQLDKIATTYELEIAPARGDSTLREPTTIWVVRVGDDLYVRSWRGPSGVWYRAARAHEEGHISAGGVEKEVAFVEVSDPELNDQIDEAYREKYGHSEYVEPMVRPEARSTTIKLVPR